MAREALFTGFRLLVAASQAHCSDLANIGLSGYFILSNCDRAADHWTFTLLAMIGGEMKILFFH